VILDLDPGVDDALAILMALHSPELEIIGLTTVSGNVPLDQTIENALKVLELAGRTDILVCMGAARPLAREPRHAYEVHGPEGLGASELPEPETMSAGDAVDFRADPYRPVPPNRLSSWLPWYRHPACT
jgi:purine nucleosidase